MKNISKILVLIMSSIFIIGCSISEEITLNANGNINYSYLLDASKCTHMLPDTIGQPKIIKDTTFSFVNFLKEKKDSISNLSLDEQKKLYTLKPFSIKIHQDDNKKEFTIQLFGNFKDVNSLNSALSSFSTISQNNLNVLSEVNFSLLTHIQYNWDGKIFKKKVLEHIEKNDSTKIILSTMFYGGFYDVKYNFPKKIKKANNPSAIISSDRKSLFIRNDATDYIMFPEKLNIEIELEN